MSKVTVGGKAWSAFTAAEETIDFAASTLTAAVIGDLRNIVAEFGATEAVPLRQARFDPRDRVIPRAPAAVHTHKPASRTEKVAVSVRNSTSLAACSGTQCHLTLPTAYAHHSVWRGSNQPQSAPISLGLCAAGLSSAWPRTDRILRFCAQATWSKSTLSRLTVHSG